MENSIIPQYFAVKNDGTPEFKRFIEWFNKKYNISWDGVIDVYYGYDGNLSMSGYTNLFKNNPVIFESAAEFMKLVDGDEKMEKSNLPHDVEFYLKFKDYADKIIGYWDGVNWAAKNGYVKIEEDKIVVSKHEYEKSNAVCEAKDSLAKELSKAVVLEENQAVITWEKYDANKSRNEAHWRDGEVMFKIPHAPQPKLREIVICIWKDTQGGLHVFNNITHNVKETLPSDWKLIKTIKETI